MTRLLLFVLYAATVSLPCLRSRAQAGPAAVKAKKERQVELYGSVYDSFTKAPLKARVTLMHAEDSSVVDTTTCWTWDRESYYEMKVPAHPGSYIIKGTCDGYEDGYQDYHLRHLARNNRFELPRLLLKKKMDDIWREDSLGGIVVTGTKVKFAYRGDTLVYNASAFNLPEGSMLDGLIRQMPGAELKDNGDIYINGRKVDYLTLNGKDFFKGQNQVMLDNLPYFTVRELKVYDKSTKQSQLLGHDVEKKDYVMDVQLKRQYNRGLMGNAEAGRGTEDRYMGRLFGLYYDDNTRLSLFGNVNNVNETRRPGSEGEWRPSEMPVGLRATKMAGMNMNTEDADKRWEEEMSATVTWSDAESHTRNSSETFAGAGSIFGGAASWSRQKDFRLHAENRFQMEKPIILWSSVSMDYADGDRSNGSRDSTYRYNIINSTLNDGMNRYRTLSLNGNITIQKKFEWGDYIGLTLNGSYNSSKPTEGFSRSQTYYAQTGDHELRHYYNDTPSKDYNYQARASYTFQMPGRWYISSSASYRQSLSDENNSRYRLDWLYDAPLSGDLSLDWLPSDRAVLDSVIDFFNSDAQMHFTRAYSASVEVFKSSDNGFFQLSLPVNNVHERLNYTDLFLDTLAHRSYTHFSPSISIYRWNIKRGLEHASYRVQRDEPQLSSLLPVDDTTNPLATHINNPSLKARTTHSARLAFAFNNDSTRRFLRLWANASIVRNAWGTHTVYEETTGAYIFIRDNINGNWNCSIGANYQHPLDKKKRLTLTQRNDAAYLHSVDFDLTYIDALLQQTEQKSTVHNLTLSETLKLEYQKDKLTVSASGHLDYRLSSSRRDNFQPINAFDYDYGVTFNYTIPVIKLDVATDLRMFSRRGYYSAMMNDNHLVWNAQLSRTFLKGRITARLQAFDLLHQLSNTQYNVNAQGRTETWQQCIPRYLMLSLAYKLTQKPKS